MKTPDVLYCDNHVLVAVKPPNVPAQADISGDEDMLTMMRAYVKERYQKPGAVFLGLVHRRRPLRPRPAGRADGPVGRAPDLHASDPGPGHVLCCPAAHVVSLEQIQYY